MEEPEPLQLGLLLEGGDVRLQADLLWRSMRAELDRSKGEVRTSIGPAVRASGLQGRSARGRGLGVLVDGVDPRSDTGRTVGIMAERVRQVTLLRILLGGLSGRGWKRSSWRVGR